MKMKMFSLAGTLVLVAGCASVQTVVREPVGPCTPPLATSSGNGSLVVYSCWDFGLAVDYDYVARAPYDVYSPDGTHRHHVFNDVGGFDRYAVTLPLAVGEYKVSSFVPGLGQTSVPVQIKAGQTTTLHLDGSANRLKKRVPAQNLVRLPDGDVAGWRGNENTPANTK